MKSNDILSSGGAPDLTFQLGELVDRCAAPGRASWLDIPVSPGVYIVALPVGQCAVEFNQSAGKASSGPADIDYLRRKWDEITRQASTDIIYIGRATSLRKRIRHLARFGAGLTDTHKGGEWMWYIDGIHDMTLIMKTCHPGEEIQRERSLLEDFRTEHGSLPLANRSAGQQGHPRPQPSTASG